MSFLSKFISELFGSSEFKNSTISEPVQKEKKVRRKSGRVTKFDQVTQHLLEHGTITSWEAIQQYGATRLSAIIFKLRNSGYVIESIPCTELDRNKNTSNFVTYKLHN